MTILWTLILIGFIVFYEIWLHYDVNGDSYMDSLSKGEDDYGWILYEWRFWCSFIRYKYIHFPDLLQNWIRGYHPLPWKHDFSWADLCNDN